MFGTSEGRGGYDRVRLKPCKRCGSRLDNNVETCPDCGEDVTGPSLPTADRRPGGFATWSIASGLIVRFMALLTPGLIGYAIGGWWVAAGGVGLGIVALAAWDSD